MTISVDQRRITASKHPEVHARIVGSLASLRSLQVQLAHDFARIDESRHFLHEGCASIVEYGVRLGYSADEVRTYTNLGKVFAQERSAEQQFLDGKLALEAGAAIGRIYSTPALLRPGDRWLDHAQQDPMKTLRRRIKERIELQAQNQVGLEEIHVMVSARSKDRFDRAREVASQQAGKHLSQGQTLTRVVDFYLEKNDPQLRKGRTRRVGPTSERPASRYIPAEVKRAVLKRSGGTCEVTTCHHRLGLEFAHRTPHAQGSAREVEDIGQLCHRHHVLYDAGEIPWPVPPDGVAESLPRVVASRCDQGVNLVRTAERRTTNPRASARSASRHAQKSQRVPAHL